MNRLCKAVLLAVVFCCLAAMLACGGTGSMTSTPAASPNPPSAPATPSAAQGSVVLVMEENHSYEQVIGNPNMQYLNGLAQQGALATQYYATLHPSLPNYFELTTGAVQTIDDNFPGSISADNLARELIASGKTWKVYAEDLPSPGYLGSSTGNYIKHHNPFTYFTDVINNPAQAANIVPFTQFASDLAAGQLPAFAMIVPNLLDDAHSCRTGTVCDDNVMLANADTWLKSNIAPLFTNAEFQKNGLLLIVFDESILADLRNGGGHVPLVAVGPKAKPGVQSSISYSHQNTLRTMCTVLGLTTCPGAGATAAAEDDLLTH